jgi:hypothetical protein
MSNIRTHLLTGRVRQIIGAGFYQAPVFKAFLYRLTKLRHGGFFVFAVAQQMKVEGTTNIT